MVRRVARCTAGARRRRNSPRHDGANGSTWHFANVLLNIHNGCIPSGRTENRCKLIQVNRRDNKTGEQWMGKEADDVRNDTKGRKPDYKRDWEKWPRLLPKRQKPFHGHPLDAVKKPSAGRAFIATFILHPLSLHSPSKFNKEQLSRKPYLYKNAHSSQRHGWDQSVLSQILRVHWLDSKDPGISRVICHYALVNSSALNKIS